MPGYENRRGNSAFIIVYRYVKRVEEFGFTVFFICCYFNISYIIKKNYSLVGYCPYNLNGLLSVQFK